MSRRADLPAVDSHFGQKILKMVLFLLAFCEILFIEGNLSLGKGRVMRSDDETR